MSVGQREAYRIAAQRAREADQASLVTPKGADILGRVKPPPVAPEMPPELSQMQSTWQQAAAQRSQQMKAAEPFLQAVELGAPKGSYSANFVRSLREQIAQGRNLSQSQMQTLQNLSTQLPPDTQHEILRLLTEQMSQK
jgi:hypothetical protein